MKILAFSDVGKWEGYEELVDRIKPDVIALAGDLTSEGFASFWSEAVEQIPEFQREKKHLMKKFGVNKYGVCTRQNLEEWVHAQDSLEDKYQDTKEFLENRKRIHVDKFYKFLRYSGKKSKVLVVKGDHDDDFKDDYIPERINKIAGCKEISGKIEKIKNLCFIGLSFNETHYVRTLESIVENFKNRVDVVITHCEQGKVPVVSCLNPKIMIRGHFGSGKYLVNGIPSVFTMGVKYTVVNIEAKGPPRILQYAVDRIDGKIKILEKGSCAPWFSKVSKFERYKWLQPYPEI